MGHAKTDASCIDVMMEQCKLHGFAPFHVKGDSLGYIYNRCVDSRRPLIADLAHDMSLTHTFMGQDMGRNQERIFARRIRGNRDSAGNRRDLQRGAEDSQRTI